MQQNVENKEILGLVRLKRLAPLWSLPCSHKFTKFLCGGLLLEPFLPGNYSGRRNWVLVDVHYIMDRKLLSMFFGIVLVSKIGGDGYFLMYSNACQLYYLSLVSLLDYALCHPVLYTFVYSQLEGGYCTLFGVQGTICALIR